MEKIDLEFVEEYEVLGEKRYRLRIKDTNIILNVGASSLEEARKKALELIRDLEIDKFVRLLREKGEAH